MTCVSVQNPIRFVYICTRAKIFTQDPSLNLCFWESLRAFAYPLCTTLQAVSRRKNASKGSKIRIENFTAWHFFASIFVRALSVKNRSHLQKKKKKRSLPIQPSFRNLSPPSLPFFIIIFFNPVTNMKCHTPTNLNKARRQHMQFFFFLNTFFVSISHAYVRVFVFVLPCNFHIEEANAIKRERFPIALNFSRLAANEKEI